MAQSQASAQLAHQMAGQQQMLGQPHLAGQQHPASSQLQLGNQMMGVAFHGAHIMGAQAID